MTSPNSRANPTVADCGQDHGAVPRGITDIHVHAIPPPVIELVRGRQASMRTRIEVRGDQEVVVHDGGYEYLLSQEFHDADALLRGMDRRGVSVSVLSPAPPFFCYWASDPVAREIARAMNDGLLALTRKAPGRLRAFASLPAQHVEAALTEIDRIAGHREFVGVSLGTTIGQTTLDDPSLEPVLHALEEAGLLLLTHPYYTGPQEDLRAYYLTNLLGNPLQTSAMVARLIFSGLLERMPNLKVLTVHGGGFVPYQLGRLGRGYQVRPELDGRGAAPADLLRRFWFDTVLFEPRALRFLVDLVGSDRVAMGSDSPFDMGEPTPVDFVRSAGLEPRDMQAVLSDTAADLLAPRSDPAAFAQHT
jgi:aminocarboxymuconate-semialdehyde decarboxylase